MKSICSLAALVLAMSAAALATVTLSPTSLSFPVQLLATTSSGKTVTVKNGNTTTLQISGISVTGDFSIPSKTCGTSLAAGASCTITVAFRPTWRNTRTGTLTISNNSGTSLKVALSGVGTFVQRTSSSLVFSKQLLNTTSAAKTVTLKNVGSSSVSFYTFTRTGDFAIALNKCSGTTVAPLASCTVTVTFDPTAINTRTGTLILSDNGGGSPQTVSLSGTGTEVALSPTALVFSAQRVNTTSASKPINVSNKGTTTLTLSSISVSGDFAITSKTCGSTLAAAATCTVNIAFKPTATGTRTGTLSVSDNGGASPAQASLSGVGTSAVSVSPASLTFGATLVSTASATQSVTLKNNSTATLGITAVTTSGDFARSGGTCATSLAASATCTIAVAFTPTASGIRNGTLSISLNDGSSPTLVSLSGSSASVPSLTDVLAAITKVNDYWIANKNPVTADNQWFSSTYFTGNFAAYQATSNASYLDLATNWATAHTWSLIGGDTTRFADNQAAGEVYLKLYGINQDPTRIAHIAASVHNMVISTTSSDWTWIDALNMAMPSFAELGKIKNDTSYWSRMFEFYNHTKRVEGGPGLYNATDHLWFRDKTFLPPKVGPNGKPIYWSRGNGWVLAAHAKVLALLPTTDPHYQEYLTTFQDMASALVSRQRQDGFWSVDLADPQDFPGPETSGTAFFVFGIAWGINNGVLDKATYLPVVATAWNGLVTTAVQPSGFLGYVQGVGNQPSSSQPVTVNTTADFGVGSFLLAAREVAKLAQ